jgi:putative Mg2+ transporter-C (MgtC) family protein
MHDHWEIMDVYKALISVAAGLILGLERELKDKAAGLKTITIICLGATLFSIISMKLDTANPTTLAAYIVSGVGFIGAGAIFRDGFSVSGLTTAGIIWLSAAVGTSIGFGEFYLAATFVASSLIIVVATPLISKLTSPSSQSRQLKFTIAKKDFEQKECILQIIRNEVSAVAEKKIELTPGNSIEITTEVLIKNNNTGKLRQLLVNNEFIQAFSM